MAIGFLSWRASRLSNFAALLDDKPVYLPLFLLGERRTLAGWGRRPIANATLCLAKGLKLNFLTVEDGFVRSVARLDAPLSIIVDDKGVYFDATMPSRLESLIRIPLNDAQSARVRGLMEVWKQKRVSKYNYAREYGGLLPERFVLVCDQTFGDQSVKYGASNDASFQRMLQAALHENPDCKVLIKTHPDVFVRKKRGYFASETTAGRHRIQIVAEDCHPVRLIEEAEAVYTVTSQMGFEALIWGKRVRCFGMPFYAGWGLTDDELPVPERRRPVTLEQLVHAALVKYPRYIDPVTLKRCEPEMAFRHVGLQRRKRLAFPRHVTAIGFSRWKRPFIQRFLQGSDVVFAKTPSAKPSPAASSAIALWGSAEPPAVTIGTPILRIEDGFLRSSGLGADLVRPLSLVIDDIGIYYDAMRPSRLERILETQELDDAAIRRADALHARIVELDLTKYNLGQQGWSRPTSQRPVILVVGQVEKDASIRLGSPDVKSNIELIRRVRKEHPSAHIVYKPHPDVLAGLRRQGEGELASCDIADEILTRPVSLGVLLGQVDELHTMTSLMGFEALIRGVKVVCHGLPFYAGWGLTDDRVACARRTRRLTLSELVHGALITYPRYFNYERDCFVEPEQAVEQLATMAQDGPQGRSWQRKVLRAAILAWLKLNGSTR